MLCLVMFISLNDAVLCVLYVMCLIDVQVVDEGLVSMLCIVGLEVLVVM